MRMLLSTVNTGMCMGIAVTGFFTQSCNWQGWAVAGMGWLCCLLSELEIKQ